MDSFLGIGFLIVYSITDREMINLARFKQTSDALLHKKKQENRNIVKPSDADKYYSALSRKGAILFFLN
jgi:hypothetical protein